MLECCTSKLLEQRLKSFLMCLCTSILINIGSAADSSATRDQRIEVYRSPSCASSAFDQLLKALGDLVADNNKFLVIGDFNFPDILWSPHMDSRPASLSARRFVELCENLNLHQLVSKGTHGTNILDLVLTNSEGLVRDVAVKAPIGNSDHASVHFWITTRMEESSGISMKRNFKKANFDDILAYLSNIDWFGSLATVETIIFGQYVR
ncbi:hypothetical protein OSTOST_05026 [Ostertagia ostertagi]